MKIVFIIVLPMKVFVKPLMSFLDSRLGRHLSHVPEPLQRESPQTAGRKAGIRLRADPEQYISARSNAA
jgi:hypothetical protein